MNIKLLTMAFTRPDIIERCIDTLIAPDVEHYILDQHYPLPAYAENRKWLENFCHREGRGIHLIDAGRNLGYHEGINWAVEHMDLADEDIVVNLDPDAMIQNGSENWLNAIRAAFTFDPTLAVVGLNNETIDRELKERGYFDEEYAWGGVTSGEFNIDSLTLRFMHRPVVMSIVAWQAGFIRKVGGLKENTMHYGGVEAIMFPILCAHQRRWAVLKDYWEDVSLWYEADKEYLDWKRKHGQEHSWTGDFESYLRHIGKIK